MPRFYGRMTLQVRSRPVLPHYRPPSPGILCFASSSLELFPYECGTATLVDRTPERGDVPDVVDVLSEAFFDYSVMRFVLGQRPDYAERLPQLVALFVAARALRGRCNVRRARRHTARRCGNDVEPGGPAASPISSRLRDEGWLRLGAEAEQRYEQCVATWPLIAVDRPQLHVHMIGVRGAYRGRGLARQLLETVHALCEQSPVAEGVSLTTEDPRNVALYQHLGYRVVGEARIADDLYTWSFFAIGQACVRERPPRTERRPHEKLHCFRLLRLFLLAACGSASPPADSGSTKAATADPVQAVSFLGDTLRTLPLPAETRTRYEQQLAQAKTAYDHTPNNVDSIIWYARRLGYLGRFREAIEVYGQGCCAVPGQPLALPPPRAPLHLGARARQCDQRPGARRPAGAGQTRCRRARRSAERAQHTDRHAALEHRLPPCSRLLPEG